MNNNNKQLFLQFLDENTRSKFLFYGGPDCVNTNDGLEYYIDSGIIPDFLGGPCPVSSSIFYYYADIYLNSISISGIYFLISQ